MHVLLRNFDTRPRTFSSLSHIACTLIAPEIFSTTLAEVSQITLTRISREKKIMEKIILSNCLSFIKEIDIFDLVANRVFFRGQSISGNLLPSIARLDPKIDTTVMEKEILKQLRLQGSSMLPDSNETDLDILVRAQHYGLKTRLLDWTSNPLAALWFACSDRRPGDVYVYALIADDLLDEDVFESNPFASSKTQVFQPRMNNNRIIAQHGWFTLHRYSKSSKRFVSLETNSEIKKHLYQYTIPAQYRDETLISLDRLGVNAKTIFPDFDGLCRHLNWQFIALSQSQ
ncbi:hypothetical protein LT85_2823 [Collimonas arenae]|uniref:FRG domain-containing protein n=1 Tax=Collimonas arenae TaxID=279058 RepID=A0A0A1FBQ6_9BURK|nr:FRG domain-containing protein [Collimonas arenae]AIY41981.1 hypothetical protein LT85_2823 [Collimonas arenae]